MRISCSGCNEWSRAWCKPAAGMLVDALQHWNVAPEEALAIGRERESARAHARAREREKAREREREREREKDCLCYIII